MKTGRLLKFERPGGTVRAYFFREEGRCRAAIYVAGAGAHPELPAHELSGADEAEVEGRARAWLEQHYPR